jgi:beta-glucosidase
MINSIKEIINSIKEIINQLTIEEKVKLCTGKDFWHFNGVSRLEIPSIMVTDGPHGLRKQSGESDHIGLNESVPSTCFPTAVTLASSWDRALLEEIGIALGNTCIEENVSIILGPGVNIKRSPLCGRNFEYFSEDPYLTGELAVSMINGVQSRGVGTSLKHFVANNQEAYRMSIDTFVDERALREIYLFAFEKAVKESKPWTVMCSYNKLNGTYLAENKRLLTDILKNEWGHEGIVVTDWGANNDRTLGLLAGQDIDMPSTYGSSEKELLKAISDGRLKEKDIDSTIERILKIILKSKESLNKKSEYNEDIQHNLARKASAQSMVLLKNNDDILPLSQNQSICLIGEFAVIPRYQGAGSSLVKPTRLDNAYDSYKKEFGKDIPYARGYDSKTDIIDLELINQSVDLAKTVDVPIIMVGLTDSYESEGFDRDDMNMPKSHIKLIEEVSKVNNNTIVILSNGSPVTMDWENNVKGIIEMYLSGQAGGLALWDIIYGFENPSGKLAESFPFTHVDNPSYGNFNTNSKGISYNESIYVGYRYYEKAYKKVRYPFGYGLSYTTFNYSDINFDKDSMKDNEELIVSLKIKNTGAFAGKEVIQLYVKDIKSTIFKPEKELKEFIKVHLEPGEEKTVSMSLNKRSFSYYNVDIKDWYVESGDYEILIGSSSEDIRLSKSIYVQSTSESHIDINNFSDLKSYYEISNDNYKILSEFEKLYGKKIIINSIDTKGKFNRNTTLEEIKDTFIGKIILKIINSQMNKILGNIDQKQVNMMKNMVNQMPLRNFSMLSGGKVSLDMLDGMILIMNRKPLRGLIKLVIR